jgi:hypothetical protein
MPNRTDTLTPDPANPNRMAPEDKARMARSLAEFGDLSGVVLNRRTGLLVGGHQRADVLTGATQHVEDVAPEPDGTVARGWLEHGGRRYGLRVVDWPPEKAHAALLAANRFGRIGKDDAALLKDLLEQLDTGTTDMDLTGYTQDAIEALMLQTRQDGDADAEPQMDRAEQLRDKWGVEKGDIWLIGDHRLLCGDSMKAADVARLMTGNRPDVAVIDPPFEFDTLPHVMDPCIVFGQAKHIRMIPAALWRFERIINKVTMHRSATTKVGHMHAFVAQCGTVRQCPDDGKTYPSIVAYGDRPDHPHEKPVALVVEHLTVWTPPWALCFDPFAGSGTTIMAAEQLRRRCYAVEMNPCYVAVILQRYQDATGKTPQRERR